MLVPTSGVLAQRVHGVVRDTLSGDPVAGAVVSVLQATGRSLGRDLTNSVGQYSLAIPEGAARIRVVRIGFRPREVALPAASGDVQLDVALQPLPSLLQPVTVREAEECPRREDHDRALGLWEQARAALLASITARKARPGSMQMLEYHRLYTADRSVLIWQQERSLSARTSRPFLPIRAAADFAAHGYLVRGSGVRDLGAPDADVLLDDSFAATHCFSIAGSDSAHRGQIGLAFEPAPGRDRLVDVRGVLWIERAHPALRTLEFRYTGLSPVEIRAGSGGRISFATVPNGVVFVSAWSITSVRSTAPFLRLDRFESRRGDLGREIAGGTVTDARWPDGAHWDSPVAGVRGRVIAVHGAKTSGVRVWLAGTGDTLTADSTGRFRFEGLLAGPYAIEAAGPVLAAAGVAQNTPSDSALATVEDSTSVLVHLDTAMAAVRALCHAARGPAPSTLLLVRVVDADGWNIPRDTVRAKWKTPSSKVLGITISHEGHFEGITDDDGRVAVCNPLRGEPVSVTVGPEAAPQVSTTVTIPTKNPIAVTTLQLPAPRSR